MHGVDKDQAVLDAAALYQLLDLTRDVGESHPVRDIEPQFLSQVLHDVILPIWHMSRVYALIVPEALAAGKAEE